MPIAQTVPLRHWLLAALTTSFAVALRTVAQPLMGDELPFVFAFPATVFSALMWGFGPGIATAALCAAVAASGVVPPMLVATERPLQLGAFLASAILTALLCGQMRKPRVPAHPIATATPTETPLTTWLRAVLWGAFLIPVTSFVMVAWWGFERARIGTEATVAHASELAYRHAERAITIAASIAQRADDAASSPDEIARTSEAAIHQRLADLTAGVPSIVNLNVWDANGRAIVRSDLFPVDPKAVVYDRRYFQEQRDPATGVGISEVIVGRQTGLELMNVTIRRSSPDGSFRGVVAVSLSPGYFRDFYRSLAAEEPKLATFALVRTDGAVLARWPPFADGRQQLAATSPILKLVTEGRDQGNLELPADAGEQPRLMSFKRVGRYPLYVAAGYSRDAMFASWVQFTSLAAAVLLPLTTLLVYVSWLALKKTRQELAMAAALQEQVARRARAERSMLESQKLETLALLTSGVAHDFNNLLAIVSASVHLLRRKHPALADEKQMVVMSRAVTSGTRLTRQLLSFSRQQALKPETVLLQAWVPSVEGLIQSSLGPGITWQVAVAPDTRPVHVDLNELELALINLVVNARHAMPGGGTLVVRARNLEHPQQEHPAMVTIEVEDTGVGIPVELREKVLEPFFTTRSKGTGSGLGLSQVNGLCQQAGGRVRIDSTPGQGTTIVMVLPAAHTAPEEPAIAGLPPPNRLTGHVLLVEDNEDVASTIELVLCNAGLEVSRAPSAPEALAWLERARHLPDLVLSDIAMPGAMNGIGLAFALRERHPALPVLLTTGYAEQLGEATAGGLRVMQKPIPPEELLTELASMLSRRPRGPQGHTGSA